MKKEFIRHHFHLVVITNRTPVYRKQLSPIPALAAGDWLGDVVNDLHFQDACRAINE